MYEAIYQFPEIGKDIINGSEWNNLKKFHLKHFKFVDDIFLKLEKKRTTKKLTNNENKIYFFSRSLFVRTLMILFSKQKIESNFVELMNLPSLFEQPHPTLFNEKAKLKFFINYHLYNFYLNFSAILDNLAWSLNYFYGLGFKEKDKSKLKCTLISGMFLHNLKIKNEKIVSYMTSENMEKWLDDKYLKRHVNAHRQIITLAEVFLKQEGITILKANIEDGDEMIFYDVLDDVRETSDKLIDLIELICGEISSKIVS